MSPKPELPPRLKALVAKRAECISEIVLRGDVPMFVTSAKGVLSVNGAARRALARIDPEAGKWLAADRPMTSRIVVVDRKAVLLLNGSARGGWRVRTIAPTGR